MKPRVKRRLMRQIRIIIEKHDGYYVGYPLGIKGACVGQGDTYDKALDCVNAMLKSHIAAFGPDVFEDDDNPVREVFVAETQISA